jgi:hypothetical protein
MGISCQNEVIKTRDMRTNTALHNNIMLHCTIVKEMLGVNAVSEFFDLGMRFDSTPSLPID